MRCHKCQGSGQVMGNGMIFRDCDCDDGVVRESCATSVAIDKRSKSYREAIQKIMESNDVSREEATAIFDEEYAKI